jgi:hypothetical protein
LEAVLRPFEPINLFHYLIRVDWPEAAALLDKLVNDSPQFFFLVLIEHKIWGFAGFAALF